MRKRDEHKGGKSEQKKAFFHSHLSGKRRQRAGGKRFVSVCVVKHSISVEILLRC